MKMYIKTKKSGQKYIIHGVFHGEQPPVDSYTYLALENIIGADTVMSNGMKAWDFALSCASLAPAWISEAEGQYTLTIDINDLKIAKIAKLQSLTTNAIFKYMPEWRQQRWSIFAEIYEKKKDKLKTTDREQIIYDGMIDISKGETEDSVYSKVVAATTWLHQCLLIHNNIESAILALSDPIEVLQYNTEPTYPGFPG